METDAGLRRRNVSHLAERTSSPPSHTKPTGSEHGVSVQILRGVLLFTWMNTCCIVVHLTQLAGVWLYFVNRDLYYAWMSQTKQSFGLLITTITQWFAPMTVRISGSKDCRSQIKIGTDGRLDMTGLPERLILIANHQLYSDWLFLWWIAYTAKLHGHIYIILKESLKWIPIIGPGMQFYGFIFMARNWAKDQARLQYRLKKLNTRHGGPLSGKEGEDSLDPMWLLIFPEGTNLSANTRKKSKAFADRIGVEDFKHVLLPRSTGLHCCLQELKSTVDWIYDCTVAYEGIPPGQYGQDVYTNRGIYFGGRPPKSVNMHWRRFNVSAIPVSSQSEFEAWIMDRWREKEALLDFYEQTGHFPADTVNPASTSSASTALPNREDDHPAVGDMTTSKAWVKGGSQNKEYDYLETKVSVKGVLEVTTIFAPLMLLACSLWLISLALNYLVGR